MVLKLLHSLLLGLCLTASAIPTRAANLLVQGGDFEAGTDGIGITPVVLLRNWPSYVAPSIDSTTAGEGSRSLKVVNGSGEDVFELRSRAFHLDKPQVAVSVSFLPGPTPWAQRWMQEFAAGRRL
jgi:hypothetical protein